MANTSFNGPVYSQYGFKVGNPNNPSTSPVANVLASQVTPALTVTATANTDFTMTIPAGARVTTFRLYITTAYTGATPTIQIGTAATGSQYVAATAISSGGVLTLTPASTVACAAAMLSSPGTLYIRITQAATLTAVGSSVLEVLYSV